MHHHSWLYHDAGDVGRNEKASQKCYAAEPAWVLPAQPGGEGFWECNKRKPDPAVRQLDKGHQPERPELRERFLLSCVTAKDDGNSIGTKTGGSSLERITQFRRRSTLNGSKPDLSAVVNKPRPTLQDVKNLDVVNQEEETGMEKALNFAGAIDHLKHHLLGHSCGSSRCKLELGGRLQALHSLRQLLCENGHSGNSSPGLNDDAGDVSQGDASSTVTGETRMQVSKERLVEAGLMRIMAHLICSAGISTSEREAALIICDQLFLAGGEVFEESRQRSHPDDPAAKERRLHCRFEQNLALEATPTVVELAASGLPSEKRLASALLGSFAAVDCEKCILSGAFNVLNWLKEHGTMPQKKAADQALKKAHAAAAFCLTRIVDAAKYHGTTIRIHANTVYYVDNKEKVLVGYNGSYAPPLSADLVSSLVNLVEEPIIFVERKDWEKARGTYWWNNSVMVTPAPEGPAFAPGRRCASTLYDQAEPRISDQPFDVIQMLEFSVEEANEKAEERANAAAALGDLAEKHALQINANGGMLVLMRLHKSSYGLERDAAEKALEKLVKQADAIGSRTDDYQKFVEQQAMARQKKEQKLMRRQHHI